MKAKRPLTPTQQLKKFKRRVASHTYREFLALYKPISVRSVPARIDSAAVNQVWHGGELTFEFLWSEIRDKEVRSLVGGLLLLLEEQGCMARIAQDVAIGVLEDKAALATMAPLGGKKLSENRARPNLDKLIRACLARGEKTRTYAKEWAIDFNVSADTIERAVKRVKRELAKT